MNSINKYYNDRVYYSSDSNNNSKYMITFVNSSSGESYSEPTSWIWPKCIQVISQGVIH